MWLVLAQLICDADLIAQEMEKLKVDLKRLPLGASAHTWLTHRVDWECIAATDRQTDRQSQRPMLAVDATRQS